VVGKREGRKAGEGGERKESGRRREGKINSNLSLNSATYTTFCIKKMKSPSHTPRKKRSPQTPYISLHSYCNARNSLPHFLIFANMEKVVEGGSATTTIK
jgi:hypothetical protein